MQGKYRVITLCGSTHFKDDFFRVQKELTLDGNIVISVGLFGHSGDDEAWTLGTKEMLDDMHLSKIDMADEIFVVNPGGYVGESTAREIGYALLRGKTVKSIVPIHLGRYASKEGFNQKILDPKTESERLMTAQWNISTKVWNRAIAFEADSVKYVYFVAETKGSMSSLDLRGIESGKIACAEKLFAQLSTSDVHYGKIDSFDQLMTLVR